MSAPFVLVANGNALSLVVYDPTGVEIYRRTVTGDEYRRASLEAAHVANTADPPKALERRMHRYAARFDQERAQLMVYEEVDGRAAATARPTGLQLFHNASCWQSIGDVWRIAIHYFSFTELVLTRADGTVETRAD